MGKHDDNKPIISLARLWQYIIMGVPYYGYVREDENCKRYIEFDIGEKILTVGRLIYIVQSGDTLSGIANKYGLNIVDLLNWNDIEDANKIMVGQNIEIIDKTYRQAAAAIEFMSTYFSKPPYAPIKTKQEEQSKNNDNFDIWGLASLGFAVYDEYSDASFFKIFKEKFNVAFDRQVINNVEVLIDEGGKVWQAGASKGGFVGADNSKLVKKAVTTRLSWWARAQPYYAPILKVLGFGFGVFATRQSFLQYKKTHSVADGANTIINAISLFVWEVGAAAMYCQIVGSSNIQQIRQNINEGRNPLSGVYNMQTGQYMVPMNFFGVEVAW